MDDHPRHRHEVGPGDGKVPDDIAKIAFENAGSEHFAAVYADVTDTTTTIKHMDCCAADGCPDGSCDQYVAEAEGKQGDDLVAFLTKED